MPGAAVGSTVGEGLQRWPREIAALFFSLFLKVMRERHTTGEMHFVSASRFHTFVLAEAALRSGSHESENAQAAIPRGQGCRSTIRDTQAQSYAFSAKPF